MARLLLILGLLAACRIGLSWWVRSPYIFSDELLYGEFARSLLTHGTFLMRGEFVNFPSVLYPLLLAPTQLLPDAYLSFRAIQSLNALLMCSAGIPVYLIARGWFSTQPATAIALLSVLPPYALYSNVVMSESLFFPLVMWTAYATLQAATKPGIGTKIGLGIALGLAFFTKPHGMVLLPLASMAALTCSLWQPDGPSAFRRAVSYWPTAAILLVVGIFHIIKTNLGLRSEHLWDVTTFFGTYSGVFASRGPFPYLYFFNSALANAAALALSLGLLPLVWFTQFAIQRWRTGEQRDRVFLVFTLVLAILLVGLTAKHTAVEDPRRIHERYCFHLAPLLLLGAARWLQLNRLSGKGVWAGIVAGHILCVAYIPQALNSPFVTDTPSYSAFWVLTNLMSVRATVSVALVAGLLFSWQLFRAAQGRRWARSFGLAAAYMAVLTLMSLPSQQSESSNFAHRLPYVDWIQTSAEPGKPIAFLTDNRIFADRNFNNVYLADFFMRDPVLTYARENILDGWNDRRLEIEPDGRLPQMCALPEGSLIVSQAHHVLNQPIVSRRGTDVLYRKGGEVRLLAIR